MRVCDEVVGLPCTHRRRRYRNWAVFMHLLSDSLRYSPRFGEIGKISNQNYADLVILFRVIVWK